VIHETTKRSQFVGFVELHLREKCYLWKHLRIWNFFTSKKHCPINILSLTKEIFLQVKAQLLWTFSHLLIWFFTSKSHNSIDILPLTNKILTSKNINTYVVPLWNNSRTLSAPSRGSVNSTTEFSVLATDSAAPPSFPINEFQAHKKMLRLSFFQFIPKFYFENFT
jgi:hypothetical protein